MGLYLMAAIYTVAGILHFTATRTYIKIMPPYLPAHKALVLLSGGAEILLGLALLIPSLRPWAAWGIILLLIAIFPANLYMLTSGKFTSLPTWVLFLRLPLQLVLIWWAYQYTK
ncbi:DoxX family protein [Tellurirhabdus bombi]|uniref:DoxX family protein n=1 Tax=Tellurirhabdus bombi TaxID=2907205 RepID=UPI001F2F0301|nr:DoxX family protein [Tellurirhabdus bombi]